MQAEESQSLVIGSYSDGKDAPSVYYFNGKEKTVSTILSEINPSYIVKSNNHYYVLAEHK
mgnify:CR=1 FL=1